jgi:hypothetical protein
MAAAPIEAAVVKKLRLASGEEPPLKTFLPVSRDQWQSLPALSIPIVVAGVYSEKVKQIANSTQASVSFTRPHRS